MYYSVCAYYSVLMGKFNPVDQCRRSGWQGTLRLVVLQQLIWWPCLMYPVLSHNHPEISYLRCTGDVKAELQANRKGSNYYSSTNANCPAFATCLSSVPIILCPGITELPLSC